ncbi:MAG TPA: hypothetical protein VK841_19665 [Polyangiaceae bacterium]|jgi:hypothetical protein|nr:hypothetical protein [Polyangiaceae bacterium]
MRESAWNGAVFSAFFVAGCLGAAGCASIWGFQDAIDERDGADATTESALDGETARPPGVGVDASVDATVDSMQDASIAPSGEDAAAADVAVESPDAASADAAEDASPLDAAIDAPASACAASCVPAAPPGWQGPLLITEVLSPDAGPPGCANASWVDTLDLVGGPSADPASCTCNCGPPSGIGCSAPSASFFRDRYCTQPCATPTAVGSACTPLSATGCGTTPHFEMGASSADGGACAPIATMSRPPLAWSSSASLCVPAPSLELGACPSGQACVPAPDPASDPPVLCVAQQGNAVCPAGYGFRHAPRSEAGADAGGDGGSPYFEQANDGRGCTACTCEAPSGAACTSSGIVAYDDSACTMIAMTIEPDAGCLAFGAPNVTNATCAGAAVSGGRCAPTGGMPTGGVTLTSPYTICCNR